MLRTQINRTISHTMAARRFLQTATVTATPTPMPMSTSTGAANKLNDKWSKHSLPRMTPGVATKTPAAPTPGSKASPMMAGARMKKLSFGRPSTKINDTIAIESSLPMPPTPAVPATPVTPTPAPEPTSGPVTPMKSKRKLRPRKAVITLSENAMVHLRRLLDSPNPQMIRISVQNRGCSGLTYHLDYVTAPQKFDEQVIQDGICVLVDSKALFSIIGSEMDWVDDKLSSRFVFTNPNSKGQCGCGESFMV